MKTISAVSIEVLLDLSTLDVVMHGRARCLQKLENASNLRIMTKVIVQSGKE